MLSLLDKWGEKQVDKMAGVHVSLSDETLQISYVILSKKKNQILIDKTGDFELISDSFHEHIPPHIPIALSISGKQVLHRLFDQSNPLLPEDIFPVVLPNASQEDFYIQYQSQRTKQAFSVVRKKHVHETIDQLKKQKNDIVQVSIAPFPILHCLRLLRKNTLHTGGHHIEIQDQEIVRIERTQDENKAEQTYRIDDHLLSGNQLMGFSAAFQLLISTPNQIHISDVDSIDYREYIQKKLFEQLKVAVPFTFLALLLINFLIYLWLDGTHRTLTEQLSSNAQLLAVSAELDNELAKKKQFVLRSGWTNSSKISFFADRIGASVPNEVRVTEMTIFPASWVKDQDQSRYEYDLNWIVIKGETSNAYIVNTWKNELKEKDWLSQVEVSYYEQSQEKKNIEFELLLHL